MESNSGQNIDEKVKQYWKECIVYFWSEIDNYYERRVVKKV